MRMTGRAHCASAAGLPSRAGSSPPLSPPLGSRARASWCRCASTNRIPGPDAACLHATATCRATHRSRERATCAAASWRASGAAAAASATPGAATGAAAEIDALVDGWRWSERDGRARLPRSRGAATTAASAALRTTSSSGIALRASGRCQSSPARPVHLPVSLQLVPCTRGSRAGRVGGPGLVWPRARCRCTRCGTLRYTEMRRWVPNRLLAGNMRGRGLGGGTP